MAAAKHEGANVTPGELIAFEKEVAAAIDAGLVPGPVHLAGGNEKQLIEIFKNIDPLDWVCATYRSHLHALLRGVPRDEVMAWILAGRSMNLNFPEHRFLTSAIVGGMLPIACGIAAAIKRRNDPNRVWCFVGDMVASIGAFQDAQQYALAQDLPIHFYVEDNGFATDTPTHRAWGKHEPTLHLRRCTSLYSYDRTWPHIGTQPKGAL